MGSSVPYDQSGRRRQKSRTRAALLEATRELLGEGITPTVEQAAKQADISRTTAYRYFPNQAALLFAIYPELESPSMLGDDAPADPVERLEIVTEAISTQLLDHQTELRAMLRLSLEKTAHLQEAPLMRRGRALVWIEDALTPLNQSMPSGDVHRLAIAIRAAIGIEPLVWLTDVAGLTPGEAVDLMRSSAHTLLRAALAEDHAGPRAG